MADQEHLRILKQGVDAWNQWRKEHLHIRPNLSGVDLNWGDLSGVDLREVDLIEASLAQSNLNGADLSGACLFMATLNAAHLSGADLEGADLKEADLKGADLSMVDLSRADLIAANLFGADLIQANLMEANLTRTNLSGADLTGAKVGWTVFGDVNLGVVNGLESVTHLAPSVIGIDTVYASQARIPEVFLRGAGVPDEFIVYMRSLVGRAIEFYSCFISYSSKDQDFAEELYADLQAKGVRCWFAPEDMKIGDKIRQRIDEAIHRYDKLLLVLSQNSVESTWVEKEVETAFEEESRRKRTILFPVRLDDTVMKTGTAWAADIRRTRHIGDFQGWEDHDAYKAAFDRLLRDLKAEGQQAADASDVQS